MSETKTVWHPYPKEKPASSGHFLITTRDNDRQMLRTNVDFFDADEGIFWCEDTEFFGIEFTLNVIAWAELPRPYQPK